MKVKWQMRADAGKCTVCHMCQLVCSLKHEETFNPSKAFIKIASGIEADGRMEVGISFDDHCDRCGLCAQYCVYGVLSREKLPNLQTG